MSDTFGFAEQNVDTHADLVDIDGVEAPSSELLPKGWYNCTIEEHKYDLSQSAGQPCWYLVCVIDDGDYAGRKVYPNISFSPKALPYTKKNLTTCWPYLLEDQAYRVNGSFSPKAVADSGVLEGTQIKVMIGTQKYEGEMKNNVRKLMPADDTNSFLTT